MGRIEDLKLGEDIFVDVKGIEKELKVWGDENPNILFVDKKGYDPKKKILYFYLLRKGGFEVKADKVVSLKNNQSIFHGEYRR